MIRSSIRPDTFLDTGAFCALSDQSDRYHSLATRQFASLVTARVPLVLTNLIVDESYTWLRYRLGHRQACDFLRRVREAESSTPLEVVTVDRHLEEEAVKILERFDDQDLSYTDATSLALIQERRIVRAFTFDRHFHLVQVEVIPGLTR